MITPELKQGAGKPLYEQLYDDLRKRVESGELCYEERLPSKRKLAAHLNISQSTVENAYEQLLAEGYVESRPRRGYFVSKVEVPVAAGVTEQSGAEARQGSPWSPAPPARTEGRPEKSLCDLKTDSVDTDHFPYSVWYRLMRENIRDARGELLAQSHAEGNPELRQEIARYLLAYRGLRAKPEQIILGAGMEYLIGLVADLFRDSAFAYENPGYYKLGRVLDVRRLAASPIPLDQEGLLVDALERSRADLVFATPACHFPLGVTMSFPRRQQLLRWAAKRPGRYIIEDDFNGEFRFVLKPIPTLYSLDRGGNVIYINSFAGTLAPSLRVAYMVLPEGLLPLYRERLSFYSCSVSEFEQSIIRSFLRGGYYERHLNRMRKIYRGRRDALLEGLSPLSNRLLVSGQKAGLHLLLQMSGISERTLTERAAENGVRVYPLSGYYLKGRPETRTVIAGFAGHRSERLRQAGALLAEAWG